MTKPTHIPGPWKQATRGPNNCPVIGDCKGRMICMIAADTDEYPEHEANDSLIEITEPIIIDESDAIELIQGTTLRKNILYRQHEPIELIEKPKQKTGKNSHSHKFGGVGRNHWER